MQTEQIYSIFGKRLARARADAQLTQSELARLVGLSRASIANIEAGRQRLVLHQAVSLAQALDLESIAALLPSDLFTPKGQEAEMGTFVMSGSQTSHEEEAEIARIISGI